MIWQAALFEVVVLLLLLLFLVYSSIFMHGDRGDLVDFSKGKIKGMAPPAG